MLRYWFFFQCFVLTRASRTLSSSEHVESRGMFLNSAVLALACLTELKPLQDSAVPNILLRLLLIFFFFVFLFLEGARVHVHIEGNF